MLMTPYDLVAEIGGDFTAIQLAYLIKVNVISPPIFCSINNSFDNSLFDLGHKNEINSFLSGFYSKKCDSIISSSNDNENCLLKYSNNAMCLLNKEINADVMRSCPIPDRYVEDFGKPNLSLLKRWYAYATNFRIYNITLTGEEQLQIIALQTVFGVNAHSMLVKLLGQRVYHKNYNKQIDDGLRIFIQHCDEIGWSKFSAEINLMNELFAGDKLFSVKAPDTSFSRILSIENSYAELSRQVSEYIKLNDPDGLILRRLIADQLSSKLKEIFDAADRRSKKRQFALIPGQDKFLELLGKILDNILK